MKKSPPWLLILCVLITPGLVSCSSPPPEVKGLSVGTSASVNASFLFYANHVQAFERQGVRVNIIRYPSADEAFHDMLAGKIDIAGVSETPIAFASLERSDFSIFATLCSMSNDPKIVARVVSGITTPRDLIGKRIGTTKQGQSAHFFLHLFLLKYNIAPDAVTITHGSPKNVVDQLIGGDLDAASLFEPYLAQAAAQLDRQGHVFEEPGLYYKTFNLVALRTTLTKDPERIDRFIRGLLAGEQRLNDNTQEAIDYLSRDLNTAPEVVSNYFKAADFTIFLSNATALTILDEAKWAQDCGYISPGIRGVPDIKSLFYDSALRKYAPERVSIPGD